MISLKPKLRTAALLLTAFLMLSVFSATLFLIIYAKWSVFSSINLLPTSKVTEVAEETLVAFPVSVDTKHKLIINDPRVDSFIDSYVLAKAGNPNRLFSKMMAQLVSYDWYQNLASSVSRLLVIYPGERREEIVADFGDILGWSKSDRTLFSDYISAADPALEEGKFFPGRYVVPSDATPENVADALYENFSKQVLDRYDASVETKVPFIEAMTIASLLEREAYDFTDMRVISGIIWNRLFIDMPLQLDASLQYVRGSKISEKLWWPKVVPNDKYLDSPYNTYQNAGLPPAPIANPSIDAIVAALNPVATDCLFYFHGPKGQFYCTETYEEHVAKLKEIYGRGK